MNLREILAAIQDLTRSWITRGIALSVGFLLLWALWIYVDIYLFEDGSMWTTLPTDSIAVQRIEAQGEDFRAYEFAMVSEPYTCVVYAGEQKGGIFCVPRTEKGNAP